MSPLLLRRVPAVVAVSAGFGCATLVAILVWFCIEMAALVGR